MRIHQAMAGLATIALAACATAPKPLQGEFSSLTPKAGSQSQASGTPVRWGGEIIRVDPGNDRTCFEILGRQLDAQARPRRDDDDAGRFVACRQGFYDPEVFDKGREVTVTGTLRGEEVRKVGDYDYRYPHVDADVIYLWEKPRQHPGYYSAYPWTLGFDPWFGWPRTPVIIVHNAPHGHPHR